jgi:hypothetical protein
MVEALNLIEELKQFSGTESYYRHSFGTITYTDGIKYLAEKAECYWLIDIVASYQIDKRVKAEPFQVFQLKVNEDCTATVTISDGNDNVLAVQKLEFTDFPMKEMTLWCVGKVLLLPSEY